MWASLAKLDGLMDPFSVDMLLGTSLDNSMSLFVRLWPTMSFSLLPLGAFSWNLLGAEVLCAEPVDAALLVVTVVVDAPWSFAFSLSLQMDSLWFCCACFVLPFVVGVAEFGGQWAWAAQAQRVRLDSGFLSFQDAAVDVPGESRIAGDEQMIACSD
jgi:hypothetical protein